MPERAFSTTTWGDDWFMPLSRDQRYLSMYLELNQHCNPAGVYHIRLETIAFEAKFSLEELPALLASLPHIKWCPEHNIVWVKDFIKRQAKAKTFLTAAANYLKEIPDNGLALEVVEYNRSRYRIPIPFDSHQDHVDTVSDHTDTVSKRTSLVSIPPGRVSIPSDTPSDTDTDTDTGETGVVKGEKPESVPYQEMIEKYHQICCPTLPRVEKLSEARRKLIRARWREHPHWEFWEDFFKRVVGSTRLRGESSDRKWRASLFWCLKEENFLKILEGHYDRQLGTSKGDPRQDSGTRRRDYKESLERFRQQHG
ncbi:MAG: hypothetical protein WC551_08345 [Patescibacteria group bacterium]